MWICKVKLEANHCTVYLEQCIFMNESICITFKRWIISAVVHPVQCEGCHRASFTGFRYKCQQCFKYNLCQDCFWRGRTSGIHNPDHQMKEYTNFVSYTQPGWCVVDKDDCLKTIKYMDGYDLKNWKQTGNVFVSPSIMWLIRMLLIH